MPYAARLAGLGSSVSWLVSVRVLGLCRHRHHASRWKVRAPTSGHQTAPEWGEMASLLGPTGENVELPIGPGVFLLLELCLLFDRKKAAPSPEKQPDGPGKEAEAEVLTQLLTGCATLGWSCYFSKLEFFRHKMQITSILEVGNS